MFRLSVDRTPVAIILSVTLVDIAVFFSIQSVAWLAAYWLFMIFPRGVICAWNHHHQHLNVFKHKYMNRLLEFFYALHTGVTTHLWLLHHNYGHHRNYLDQTKDQSGWQKKDGSTMGMIAYTFIITLTAYYRGYKVGKNFPKQQQQFLLYGVLTVLLILSIAIYNPVGALFVIILPMICSLAFTAWTTYDHHAGIDTQDQFAASNNITSKLYNWLTGNLGFHTAHHYKQGVHWSELPALHELIKHKIPAARYSSPEYA